MATTINRSGVTVANDTGTPASPALDGTVLDNTWVQTFCDRIDALLTGSTFSVAGRVIAAGFGSHTFEAGGTGGQILSVRNSTAGTGNYGQVQIGNDVSVSALIARMTSSTFTGTGAYRQNAGHVVCDRPGGLVLAATDTAGKVRLVAGGANGGSVAIGTSDSGRNAHVEITAFDGNGGNSLFFGHPNTGYLSTLGSFTGTGQPIWAAYAYHSATANTFARASGSNRPTFYYADTDGAWAWAVGTVGTVDTDTGTTTTMKLAPTGQLQVWSGSVVTPGLAALAYTSTGLLWQSASQLDVFLAGSQRVTFQDTGGSLGPGVTVQNGAFGAGAVGGGNVQIGRNTSGSGAAGCVILQSASGTFHYLWIDATGDLRIHSAAPKADGSVSDTAGTVVGTQT